MKKFIISVLLMTFLIFPQHLQNSYALSCAEPDLPHIAYDKHDAVIIGTIIEVEEQSEENTKVLTVKVDKSYMGINTKIVTVHEMLSWSESYVDQTQLFFLVKAEDRWFNSLCGPSTSNIALADQYLSDKTELPLQDEIVVDEIINADDSTSISLSEHNSTITSQQEQPKSSKHTPTILAVVFALFLIILTVAFVLKRKHR